MHFRKCKKTPYYFYLCMRSRNSARVQQIRGTFACRRNGILVGEAAESGIGAPLARCYVCHTVPVSYRPCTRVGCDHSASPMLEADRTQSGYRLRPISMPRVPGHSPGKTDRSACNGRIGPRNGRIVPRVTDGYVRVSDG